MSKRLFFGCVIGLSLISLHASENITVISDLNNTSVLMSDAVQDDQRQCDGNDIEIFNSNSTIHIQGNCRNIEIFGWNNTITAEHAKQIEMFGSRNQLTMHSTHTVELFGTSNTVHAHSLKQVEIFGSHSKVYYQQSLQADQPVHISTIGAGNRVEKTKLVEPQKHTVANEKI